MASRRESDKRYGPGAGSSPAPPSNLIATERGIYAASQSLRSRIPTRHQCRARPSGAQRTQICRGLLFLILPLLVALNCFAAEEPTADLLKKARLEQRQGNDTNVVGLTTRILVVAPDNASAYQLRGSSHFKLGHFQQSVADFDKFLELHPDQAPYHWQRGISLYYAGRYEDGRKQFELHQTVNPNDVENAVWHFLCVARVGGVEKARASLIKITSDPRVPMMQIHRLFAGTGSAEEVLTAARSASNPNEALFYAHLYLGLYYEALINADLTRNHITQAAGLASRENYMGSVALVHAHLLQVNSEARSGD